VIPRPSNCRLTVSRGRDRIVSPVTRTRPLRSHQSPFQSRAGSQFLKARIINAHSRSPGRPVAHRGSFPHEVDSLGQQPRPAAAAPEAAPQPPPPPKSRRNARLTRKRRQPGPPAPPLSSAASRWTSPP
jgi:hypothetical protein